MCYASNSSETQSVGFFSEIADVQKVLCIIFATVITFPSQREYVLCMLVLYGIVTIYAELVLYTERDVILGILYCYIIYVATSLM